VRGARGPVPRARVAGGSRRNRPPRGHACAQTRWCDGWRRPSARRIGPADRGGGGSNAPGPPRQCAPAWAAVSYRRSGGQASRKPWTVRPPGWRTVNLWWSRFGPEVVGPVSSSVLRRRARTAEVLGNRRASWY